MVAVEGMRKSNVELIIDKYEKFGKVKTVSVEESTEMIGEQFSADNITAKRPGAGISPMRRDEVLGQLSQKDYEKDELI